ncbi:MAG: class I SAM-dependent methyltransferase, partial [Polyangia bacterium]
DLVDERGAGKRVLEYGCGHYGYAYRLARCGASVTAIDISDVAIDRGRVTAERYGLADRIHFQRMNAEAMDFPDDSFDFVVGAGILHHLDLRRALGEIARVLRPEGNALFMEPLGHNPLINAYRRRTPDLRTPDEHPLLMRDLELCRQYFGNVDARCFHIAALLAAAIHGTRAFAPAMRVLQAVDRALLGAIPPLRRYAWVTILLLEQRIAGMDRPTASQEAQPGIASVA